MKRVVLSTALFGALIMSAPTQAAMSWSSQAPTNLEVKKQEGGGHGGHGGHRRAKSFYLNEAQGAETEIWFPTLVRRPLSVEGSEVKLSGTGVQNYHLLYARKKSEGRDELALRYHYLNGKPTGESPRRLVAYRKGALDIVPSPLTREHQRYQSGRLASYVVLFKNKPVADQTVILTTSNGSELKLVTDAEGAFSVVLPDDFSDIRSGRSANKPAEFVLSASHIAKGTEYTTTLSADYHVDPAHWRSSWGGIAALLVGFVGGIAMVQRQRKKTETKEEKSHA